MDYVNVRLPIQTLEAKAYSTRKPMFEAENQAAVSGACMVNQQQQLIDLYDKFFAGSKKNKNPFAFSVCMEGPLIGFWVHYARTEDGVRRHYMKALYSCDGALADQLEIFLVKWEQLMSWQVLLIYPQLIEHVRSLGNFNLGFALKHLVDEKLVQCRDSIECTFGLENGNSEKHRVAEKAGASRIPHAMSVLAYCDVSTSNVS
ncbi:hypothetical protein BDY21DRAFT_366684 [Lineolata rhizophorae]|uniref:DUF7924 domain-containing protein n=1 Tax=Lineolata rhizophorae TaxID=578093 RepID=A0A6A6NQI2_9PEZI|nr:hypothetical protein BDY21DRAFT_366684 [Lineolata rhizophorae]